VTLPGQTADVQEAEVLAAVDLGSNSFHMIVARVDHGQLVIIDRLREMVRLAAGLGLDGQLDTASQQRALECLGRFGQRLRDMQAHQVRIVGTNTLRRARNSSEFLAAAERVLGHPVDVISGIEEARLIYSGVAHDARVIEGPVLVVDIGGGSTELIVGEGFEPSHLESLFIGCVGLSQDHFDAGRISAKRFQRARLAARRELLSVANRMRPLNYRHAIGSSGTIRATAEVARAIGCSDGTITLACVETIMDELIRAKRVENLKLAALSAQRAPVFPGGIAILIEAMLALDVRTMTVSDGALREGLLFDMLGRLRDEDVRERTIRAIQARYHVDLGQAERVEQTAAALLAQVRKAWSLEGRRAAQLLAWSGRLHEVGLDIAHAKYHQHGAYLLAHADLPGFARLEQQLLAKLVGFHRRRLDDIDLSDLPASWREPILALIVLLRLAVLLNRARSPSQLPPLELRADRHRLQVVFPPSWLAANPLTYADLRQEQLWLGACGYELAFDATGAEV
jgi:exopolyphosphatase/guanosine-5'-triphosphate,3'-diphosphate pyrophosphatase